MEAEARVRVKYNAVQRSAVEAAANIRSRVYAEIVNRERADADSRSKA